jgi:hypothetical protein
MKQYITNQRGLSLVELIASIPLALLVLFILTIVLINFITSYQEVRLYLQLQEELFNTLEMVRYGFLYEKFTDSPAADPKYKRPIVGLMTANSVDIGIHPNSIFLSQVGGYQARYYASGGKFFLDLNHPNMNETGIQLFPSINETVGNEKRFELIDYSIFSVKEGTQEKPEIVNVRLIGKVRFRQREQGQSIEDDTRLNTKTVKYETIVYLGNVK